MRDKFTFSNGDDLTTLDGTGRISEHIWDLERDDSNVVLVTDQQVFCWLHFLILSTDNTGGDSGLDIEFRSSDSTNGSSPNYLGIIRLLQADVAAAAVPAEYSIGVLKSNLLQYLHVWYKVVTQSLSGNTVVDCWIDDSPHTERRIQKKPS